MNEAGREGTRADGGSGAGRSRRPDVDSELAEQGLGDRHLRRLPGLIGSALRLAWRTSPRRLLVVFVLSVVNASGLAAMVVAGKSAAEQVLAAAAGHADVVNAVGSLLGVVAIGALTRLATIVVTVQSSLLGLRVQMATEVEILDAVARVPLERFEQPAFHDRVWRAMVNAVNMPNQAINGAMTFAGGALSIIALGSITASFQPVLVPVLLSAAALEVLFAGRSAKATHAAAVELVMTHQRRDILRRILFRREMAAETRAFALREPVLARFRAANEHTYDVNAKVIKANEKRTALSAGWSAVLGGVGWGLLLLLYINQHLTLPETMAAGFAFQLVRGWLQRISIAATGLYGASLFLSGFQDLLDEGAHHTTNSNNDAPPEPFHTLTLDKVSFTYPGSEVCALEDVTLSIKKGMVIALVGENGSGKTTLAKLLGQLYSPTSGVIRWDNVNTAELDPDQLRRHIAVIFQDFTRYELSAQENIGFGDATQLHDIDRIAHAAEQAGMKDYFDALPNGYDTLLTPRLGGVDLSGGQWQRIALARAFFRDAPLMVLDEPTSALDARAEKRLFDHIRALATGRTVVLISHRFSTVRSADQIIVLHEGRAVENGTHAELMAAGNGYAEMYTLQAAAFAEPGSDPNGRPVGARMSAMNTDGRVS